MLINKTLKFTLEESEDSGVFIGYGGTTKRDSDGDVIVSGAYAKTIQEGGSFPLLWHHKVDEPIGLITHLQEDDKGLLIQGQLDLNTERGRNVLSGMKMGYIDRFSVGFKAIKHDRGDDGTRFIREVKLYEISAITRNFSANDAATLIGVKSLKDQLEILQSIDNLEESEITEEQLQGTINHLQTLINKTGSEPIEITHEEQPAQTTAPLNPELLKRLRDILSR